MTTVKITQIGNSLGVVLSKELLAKLDAEKGDELFVSDIPGGLGLVRHDESFSKQMDLARQIMKEDYDVLKKLADS